MPVTEPQKNLILDWTRKIHTLEYAHRYASMTKERLNLYLGIPSIVISSLIGAQVSVPWQNNGVTQIIVAIGASIVAVLTGLLTFLKPSEVAEKHRTSSTTYEDLRHRLEILLTFNNTDETDVMGKLNQFKAEWDRLETPNVSNSNWSKAKKQVSSLGAYPQSLKLF